MRRTAYYFEPRLQGREAVVVLVDTRWTPFLLRQAGFTAPPILERKSIDGEPDLHANGHPFAWVYFRPSEAVLDEARLAGMESAEALEMAITEARRAAQAAALQLAQGEGGGEPFVLPALALAA